MSIVRHLAAWFRRSRLDAELREEIAQHARWRAEELVEQGLTPEEARRQALIQMGNPTRLREESRAVWGYAWIDGRVQDVRYGVRVLRKSPVFTTVAIASLAIGIGAGAAVFSLADAVLFRTLAARDPGGLSILRWTSGPVYPFSSLNGYGQQNAAGLASTSFSYAAYQSFRANAGRHLDVLGFADLYQVNTSRDGRSELGTAHAVSGNYFDVLGVSPVAGRALGAIDDAVNAAPAVVISDRFWKRRFGGAGTALGSNIVVNSVPFTVVGILPAAFHGTGQVGTDPDLYVPLSLHARVVPDDDPMMDPNFWWVLMIGRLKPGVRVAETRDALDVLLKRTVAMAKPALTAKDLPRMELIPGGRGQVEDRDEMRDPLKTMAWVTILVLLVACANVAGLLLARGRARVRELSIRVAIGASRTRIVGQLLTEALLIAVAGCIVGVVLARWIGMALAPALSSGGDPTEIFARVDVRVLAFALATGCGCAVLFGLLPAFRSTHLNVRSGLQDGRGAVHTPRPFLSGALVIAQIALSVLLVAGAGLLVRTVRNLERVDLGFDASNLLLFRIDASLNGYTGARAADLYTRVLERVRSTPGVVSASLSSHRLISNSSAIGVAARADEVVPEPGSADMQTFEKSHSAWSLIVDEQFFRTLGIRMARGRSFTVADERGAAVAIVNRALARQLFRSDDVIGRGFRFGSMKRSGPPLQIVGVVEDARYTSVRGDKPPTMYLYYRQHADMKNPATFEVRTAGSSLALATAMREVVRQLDPSVPVYGITTQADQIARSLRQERLFARLATVLGVVAVLLSGVGLYGLLAYAVARRGPEIGLRMALGAARGRVQWMILRESLMLAALGLLAGIPVALAGTRVLATLLFGLAPRDPATLTFAAMAMLALAAIAGYLPARRASRVDPMIALRAQ